MTTEELLKLQSVQYEILKDTIRVCEENGIKYYLFYGTLLGAIRHQGTIPWDYDIDICMNRENYEKFLSVANQLAEIYHVMHVGSGENTYIGLSRICKNGSRVYTKQHEKYAYPIHIDIFVLDYARKYPEVIRKVITSWAQYLMIAKLNKYEKEWLYDRFSGNKVKKIIVRSGEVFRKVFGEARIEKWVFNLMVDNSEIDKKEKYIILTYVQRVYPIEWFGEGKTIKYEKSNVKVPDCYDEILRARYGEYMKLPPEEQRFTADMEKWIIQF